MRIACIQFSPALGDVTGNIAKVDALIEENNILAGSLDLLLLPELALTGMNFFLCNLIVLSSPLFCVSSITRKYLSRPH